MGQQPIARSKIEHAGMAGDEAFDDFRKDPHPLWCD